MPNSDLSIVISDNREEILNSISDNVSNILTNLKISFDIQKCLSVSGVLDLLELKLPDIIICDYHYPYGKSGAELLEEIDDPFGDVYIILMSGRDESELLDVLLKFQSPNRRNHFAFLRKPIDNVSLRSILIDAIQFLSQKPLPFPCACIDFRWKNEIRPFERFRLCLDFAEIGVRLWVLILFACVTDKEKINWTTLGFNRVTQLTFGSHIALLKAIKLLDNSDMGCSTLLNKTNDRFLKHLTAINQIRNTIAAHKTLQDDKYYENFLNNNEERFRSVRKCLYELSRFKFVVPISTEIVDQSGILSYRCRVLMGHSMSFPIIVFRNKKIMLTNQVYVLTPELEPINLYPYIRFEYCNDCAKQSMFILDGQSTRGIGGKYVSVCSHDFEDTSC